MEKVKQVKLIAALTIVALLSSTSPPTHSLPRDLYTLEKLVESIGTKVIWASKPFRRNGELTCQGTYGYYSRATDYTMICQNSHLNEGSSIDNQNELISTLKHEGWHAVQYKCNGSKPVLSENQIKKGLNLKALKSLHQYHPLDAYLEAEARIIEQIPSDVYIRGFKYYCNR